jgi:large subunit ribosomal protein L35
LDWIFAFMRRTFRNNQGHAVSALNAPTMKCLLAGTPKKGCKMPKLKTKSGAKKRFKVTATGKVKTAQAGKRHGMIKRTNKFIRNARGTTTLSDQDAKIVKQFLPYA